MNFNHGIVFRHKTIYCTHGIFYTLPPNAITVFFTNQNINILQEILLLLPHNYTAYRKSGTQYFELFRT
jgi:hypothetical protein